MRFLMSAAIVVVLAITAEPSNGQDTIALYGDTGSGLSRSMTTTNVPFDIIVVMKIGESSAAAEFVMTELTLVTPGVLKLATAKINNTPLDLGDNARGEYSMAFNACVPASPQLEVVRVTYGDFSGVIGADVILSLRGFQPGDSQPSSFGGEPGYVDCTDGKHPLVPESPRYRTAARVIVPEGAVVLNPTLPVVIDGTPLGPGTVFVDADATGANNGSSWMDAYTDLQYGLIVGDPGDDVWVSEGIYTPTDSTSRDATFALVDSVKYYGGFSGTEVTLEQRDWVANETILSGEIGELHPPFWGGIGDNSYRVVSAIDAGPSTGFDGFTVRDGKDGSRGGAGIYISGGAPFIRNSIIRDNLHLSYGGGVGVFDGAEPMFVGVTIQDNAVGHTGGGVYAENGTTLRFYSVVFTGNWAAFNGGGVNTWGSGEYYDVQFLNNYADEGYGGGFRGDGILTGVLFEGNSASVGGGMAGYGTFQNVVFRANTAHQFSSIWGGGGLFGGGTLTDVLFENNDGSIVGGGMWEPLGGSTLTNVIFLGNSAGSGGAYYLGSHPYDSPIVPNLSSLTNVTFAANHASTGDSFYSRLGASDFANSIMWSGAAGTAPTQIYADGAMVSISHSLIEGSGESGAGWDGSLGTDLGGNIGADPRFMDLAAGDVHLLLSSPAVNAGDNAALPSGLVVDFDGNPRIYGPRVDMGAYEVQTFGLVSVADVRNDQGRQVRLTWSPINDDAPIQGLDITGYDIFRRVDLLRSEPLDAGRLLGSWDYLGSVPPSGAETYNLIVSTLCDSTDAGVCWSVFHVRAKTGDPYVFFDSLPDSGYSIDNLAPNVPQGLNVAYAIDGVSLEWLANEDDDFRYYKIYRGGTPDFDVTSLTPVATTTTVDWHDAVGEIGMYYRVAAVDFAGNESAAAIPVTITGSGQAPSYRFSLSSNAPNPFNPYTTISYSLAMAGDAELVVYDLAGRRVKTLVSGHVNAGQYEAQWDGRDDSGRRVSSGVYLYRLAAGELTDTRRMVLLK